MDPVKRAQAELDEMLAEMDAANPAPTAGEGNPADAAPAPEGTPAPAATDVNAQTPAPNPDPTPAPQPTHDAAYWQSRFEVMQGKYNSEVPRLSAEIAALKRQMETLAAAQQPATGENGEYRSPHVSDAVRQTRAYRKMVEEFGNDYAENHFEGAAVTAREAAQTEVTPLREEAAASARDRLHSDITRLAPNWLQTNDNPAFIQWAQSNVERYSGLPLIQLLNDAYTTGDAIRVATIFNDYEALNANRQPTDSNPNPQPSPDALLAPNNRGSASQTVDNNKGKVWTEAEAMKVLDDIAAGRIRRGSSQANELQAEIDRAYAEGRVLAR